MPSIIYEGMFILDANRYARDPGGTSGRVPQLIESAGGQMLVSRLWEERRLAYPFKGHRKGTYWLTYFRLDTGQVDDLNHQCQITDEILRHLFVRIDPRIVDTLVAHAQATPGEAKADKPDAAKAKAEATDKPEAAKAKAEATDKTEAAKAEATDKTDAKTEADTSDADKTEADKTDADGGTSQ